jgi:hypothetical protein
MGSSTLREHRAQGNDLCQVVGVFPRKPDAERDAVALRYDLARQN